MSASGCRRPGAAPRRRPTPNGARISLPATSIGSPPKNCTSDSPLGRDWVVRRPHRPTSSSPQAPEQHRTGQPHRSRARNRRRDTERAGGGTSAANLSSAHGRPSSQPTRLSAGGRRAARWRCADDGASLLDVLRDRARATGPRRTGAARRASAAAARCWSTGSRGSRASPRPGASHGRIDHHRSTASPPTVRDAGPTRSAPPGPASAASARPGIVCRLEGLRAKAPRRRPRRGRAGAPRPPVPLHRVAHDPRRLGRRAAGSARRSRPRPRRRPAARAALETRRPAGRRARRSPSARAASADDTAPPDALVAVPDGAGGWAVGATLAEARAIAGKVQGRRTTVDATPPLDAARRRPGRRRCARSWVEPAYLEPDASWCEPGGEPHTPLANGGAFGGKLAARRSRAPPARWPTSTAGRCACCSTARTSCGSGPKRPPVAGGADADGRGRAARRAHAGHRGSDRRRWPPTSSSRRSTSPGPPTSTRPARRRLGRGDRAARRRPRRRPARSPIPSRGAIAEATIGRRRHDPRARRRRASRSTRSCCAPTPRRRPHGAVLGQPRGHRRRRRPARSTTSRSGRFGVLRAVDTPPIEVEIVAERRPAGARRRRGVRRRGRGRLAATSAARPTGRRAPAGADRLPSMSNARRSLHPDRASR